MDGTFLRFIVCLLYVGCQVSARISDSQIDNVLRKALECHRNPGMAVSVVKDNQILFTRGYGYETVQRKAPVTENTIFGVASLSKSFASALLIKLLKEKSEYTIATPIKDIYNDDNIFEDDLRSKYTTIRDLLSHNMGIPSNNYIRLDTTLTRDNLYKRMKHLHPTGRFRDSYYYSNLMYGVITNIAEKIGNKSWEELVTDELLRPLGMTSTTFSTTIDHNDKSIARGYLDKYGELILVPFELSRIWGKLCGSGCVMSTAIDMAKWLLFHINTGKDMQGNKVVDRKEMLKLFKAANSINSASIDKYFKKPIVPVTTSNDGYGFGWKTGYYRGYSMLQHSGSTWGYRVLQTIIPDHKLGVFVALTGDDIGFVFRTSLTDYILDVFMDEKPWLNETTLCSFPEPWKRKESRKTSSYSKTLPLNDVYSKYMGTFWNPAYGEITVKSNSSSNGLYAVFGYTNLTLFPTATSKSVFYFESTGYFTKIINVGRMVFKFDTSLLKKAKSFEIPSLYSKDPPLFVKKVAKSSRYSSNSESGLHLSFNILAYILPVAIVWSMLC